MHSDNLVSALQAKVEEYNTKVPEDRAANVETLLSVYSRGMQSVTAEERQFSTADSVAMARVNDYLYALRVDRMDSKPIDADLLPQYHPLAVTASVPNKKLSTTPNEDAVVNAAELSGLGYEAVDGFRATWLRAVRDGEDPQERLSQLTKLTYDSKDADLLPLTTGKDI